MKKLFFLLVTIISLSFSFQPPATWSIDSTHSNLGFTVTYMTISDFKGSFRVNEATITAPNDDFSDASIVLSGDVASVNTEVSDRDKHLRSADYFDVAQYPKFSFTSTSFKKTGPQQYEVKGDFSLHGVTKEITMQVTERNGTHPMSKKPMAGLKATGSIRRLDYGISPSTPELFLSNEIAIQANLIFVKND